MTYMADDPPKIIPSTHQDNNAIVDSKTTGHFLQATIVCMNRKVTKSPLSAALPDGSRIKSTHTAMLYLFNLPEAAHPAHIFPDLKSGALLYVRQLYDQGCKINFTSYQVNVTLGKQTITTGPHNNTTGLWTVPLNTPTPP